MQGILFMPRKRIIDPEFWSDEQIAQWPYEARLFYIGLWNFADDEGRFKAHPALLKSQIFPYDNRIDIEKLKSLLNGKIQWYCVDGSQYGFIRNFFKYQRIDRPTESKLPTPRLIDDNSSSPRESLAPNTIEVKLSKVKLSEAFSPPTLEEVIAYKQEVNSIVNPQGFIDFYASKGWKVGAQGMKDWKAAFRNAAGWERWGKMPNPKKEEIYIPPLNPDPKQQEEVSKLIKETIKNMEAK